MDNNQKAKVVLIITLPRSLSTIFMRTLMNYPESKAFNDQFTQLIWKEIQLEKSTLSPQELANGLLLKFDKAILENKVVIIKDFAENITKYFMEPFNSFIKKHDPKIIYLIRHPKPTYISGLVKLNGGEVRNYDEDFIKEIKATEIYEIAWDFYAKFPGRIIITEELQEFPNKVFKEVYDYIGLDFKEELLKFEPLNKIGIPEDMLFFKEWYQDCFNSTELKAHKPNLEKVVIENKEELKRIECSTKFYNKFVEERSKYFK